MTIMDIYFQTPLNPEDVTVFLAALQYVPCTIKANVINVHTVLLP